MLAAQTLAAANLSPADLALIAVTIGPGSFTGLRAALAFAHGLSLAANIPLVGVTVGEAIAAALPPSPPLWIAHTASNNRIFLERDGTVIPVSLDAPPIPPGPISLAGNAARTLAARLPNHPIHLLDAPHPTPEGLTRAAALRRDGRLPPRSPQPLYIDPALAHAAPTRPLRNNFKPTISGQLE